MCANLAQRHVKLCFKPHLIEPVFIQARHTNSVGASLTSMVLEDHAALIVHAAPSQPEVSLHISRLRIHILPSFAAHWRWRVVVVCTSEAPVLRRDEKGVQHDRGRALISARAARRREETGKTLSTVISNQTSKTFYFLSFHFHSSISPVILPGFLGLDIRRPGRGFARWKREENQRISKGQRFRAVILKRSYQQATAAFW